MPRAYDSDEQERKGGLLIFTENVDCDGECVTEAESEGAPVCPPGCDGGCDAVYEATFTDDSITVQDMTDPPEANQKCPNCGHVQHATYTGWMTYSEA